MEFVYKLILDLINIIKSNRIGKSRRPLIYIEEISGICSELIEDETLSENKLKFIRKKLHAFGDHQIHDAFSDMTEDNRRVLIDAIAGARTFFWIRTSEQLDDKAAIIEFIKYHSYSSAEPLEILLNAIDKDEKVNIDEFDEIFGHLKDKVLGDVAKLAPLIAELKVKST